MSQAYVGLALPMASLLASLLAFGRMGSDCEIIGAFLFLLSFCVANFFVGLYASGKYVWPRER
jgi:hypothetical protein